MIFVKFKSKMRFVNNSIWYISKYGSINNDFGPTRIYGYSKWFSKLGCEVTMIYSKSNGLNNCKQKKLSHKTHYDNFKQIQINGPNIKLGFSIKRILSWIIFEINLFRFLFKQKEYPTTVIVSSLSLLTILNGLYLKRKGVKFVLEIRDIWPFSLQELKGVSNSNIFIRILSYFEKLGYNKSDLIIGTMPNLKQHVFSIIKNSDKVFCIPMGIDNSFYVEESLPLNLIEKIPKNKFIVGYAGAIGNVNALEILLKSYFYNKRGEISIVILGDGPLKNKLEKEFKDDNVIFLGAVEKSKVNSFLKKCDIVVHPIYNKNLYKYGVSPNKWIDYMYSAKPIIVSYSGYKSLINDAGCGEFVEAENIKALSNKIIEYSRMPKKELDHIGQKGKSYLEENLTYEILAKKYLNIILEDE